MKRVLAAAAILAGLASPASATEWLICSAGEEASFSMLVGSLGAGMATDFSVYAGGKAWSTKDGEGIPISKLQAFENDTMVLADVGTEDLSAVVAELRVFKASEGDGYVAAGTLRLPGIGVWAVTCEG